MEFGTTTRPSPLPLTAGHTPGEPAHGLLARAVDLNVPGALRAYRRLFGSKDGHLVTNIPPLEIAAFCSADPASVHGADLCCVSQAEFQRILRALGAWPREGVAGGWLCIDPFFLGWLVRNVRNGKDIKELADELDVTEVDARSLVQAGLVQPFVHRGWGIREFFGPTEPEALLRKLEAKVSPWRTDFRRLYPLPMAAAEIGVPLADAVIGILEGRLPVPALGKHGAGLNRVLVGVVTS